MREIVSELFSQMSLRVWHFNSLNFVIYTMVFLATYLKLVEYEHFSSFPLAAQNHRRLIFMSYLVARADNTKHDSKRGDLRVPAISNIVMQITKVTTCQKIKNGKRIACFKCLPFCKNRSL